MVNYDLPWNPNRIEQRFGRIHLIGQTEVCHLWNLVADETREGDAYRTLLEKLEQARQTLGGQVFDVLGRVCKSCLMDNLPSCRLKRIMRLRSKVKELLPKIAEAIISIEIDSLERQY